ncbi:hypothetical protein N7532_008558 [Penicillium argentinense]|uniref:Ankyrin n=1 Tax=Penicillium argentinense TaxID=1131581 RepID=A0A9W9EXU3_9EURO|nr:uncharacterized protein N7532_008558 [Penicillium argentinense]KAJ5089874.1 hypothetical protein N7532_008558 [Penicillium argentinense]
MDGFTPFHLVSEVGNLKIMKLLLSSHQASQTSLDLRDKFDRTPLFYAAARGSADVVEVILPHSSIHLKDRYGATPIFAADINGHEEIFKQLVSLIKRQVDFEDGLDRTLLWWAAGTGQTTNERSCPSAHSETGHSRPEN